MYRNPLMPLQLTEAMPEKLQPKPHPLKPKPHLPTVVMLAPVAMLAVMLALEVTSERDDSPQLFTAMQNNEKTIFHGM